MWCSFGTRPLILRPMEPHAATTATTGRLGTISPTLPRATDLFDGGGPCPNLLRLCCSHLDNGNGASVLRNWAEGQGQTASASIGTPATARRSTGCRPGSMPTCRKAPPRHQPFANSVTVARSALHRRPQTGGDAMQRRFMMLGLLALGACAMRHRCPTRQRGL